MKRMRGFSIIELLIAVLIGLLAMAATTASMQRFEASRRSSLGSSESMQNGFLAMFAIENDASKAGWGLNDAWLQNCPTIMLDSLLPDGSSGYPLGSPGQAQPLSPVTVISTASNTPDSISFYAGASNTGTGVISVSGGNYSGDASAIPVSTPAPTFLPGDLYVVAPPPSQAGRTCLIGQVSSIVTGNPNQLLHASGSISGTVASTRFNVASAAVTFSQDAKVFNLGPGDRALNRGPTPTFRRWFIQNGNLMIRASDVLTGNQVTDTLVVDNIVNLKAQLGASSVGIALVARSREVDKPESSGTCTTTTSAPRVFDQSGTGFEVDVAVAGDTVHWTCYRYRVFETVVPIRNSIWRPL